MVQWPETEVIVRIPDGSWSFSKHLKAAPCVYSEIKQYESPENCKKDCHNNDQCAGMLMTETECTTYSVNAADGDRYRPSTEFDTLRKTAECKPLESVPASRDTNHVGVFDGYEPCDYSVISFEPAGALRQNFIDSAENVLQITEPDVTTSCTATCSGLTDCDGFVVDETTSTCTMFRHNKKLREDNSGCSERLRVKPSTGKKTYYLKNVAGIEYSLMGGKRHDNPSTDTPHVKIWDQRDNLASVQKLVHDVFDVEHEYTLVLHGVDDAEELYGTSGRPQVAFKAGNNAKTNLGPDTPADKFSFGGMKFGFIDGTGTLPMVMLDCNEVPAVVGPGRDGQLTQIGSDGQGRLKAGYVAQVSHTRTLTVSWVSELLAGDWKHGYIQFTGFVLPKEVTDRSWLMLDGVEFTVEADRYVWTCDDTSRWTSETKIAIRDMPIPPAEPSFAAEPTMVLGVGRTLASTVPIYSIALPDRSKHAWESDAVTSIRLNATVQNPLCMAVALQSSDSFPYLSIAPCDGTSSQLFSLVPQGDKMKIKSKEDDRMCVADADDGKVSFLDCQLQETGWSYASTPGGTFSLQSSKHNNYVTARPGNNTVVGSKAVDVSNQQWIRYFMEPLPVDPPPPPPYLDHHKTYGLFLKNSPCHISTDRDYNRSKARSYHYAKLRCDPPDPRVRFSLEHNGGAEWRIKFHQHPYYLRCQDHDDMDTKIRLSDKPSDQNTIFHFTEIRPQHYHLQSRRNGDGAWRHMGVINNKFIFTPGGSGDGYEWHLRENP